MQAEAGPADCEPRGFGWSATVEVCSARVTRLVTDQEKSKKFSGTQLVPGTGLGGWFASIRAGRGRCLAPGWGARSKMRQAPEGPVQADDGTPRQTATEAQRGR